VRQSVCRQLESATGKKWRAVRDGFTWKYVSGKRTVRKCLESVLDWDGYSDTKFHKVYYDDQGNRLLCTGTEAVE
jgi:hypothetical protein